jgi:DNA polymerase-3 subunit gamma/tau
LAEQMAAEDVQLFYQIGLLGRRDLQMAPDLRGGLQMVLLRMLAFRPVSAEEQPRAQRPHQSRAAPQPDHQVKKAAEAPVQARSRPPTPAKDWRGLVESMQLKGVLRELAMNCALKSHDGDSWKLVLDTSHQQLLSKARQRRLESSLCEVLQRKVHVEIEVQGGTDDTPAKQQLHEAEARQADAVSAIESDANVKAIQKVFDATLHRETIRSVDN